MVILLVTIPILRGWRKRRLDYAAQKEAVHSEKNTYAFLIDEEFRVKETNLYDLNPEMNDDQPNVLGNVLHCETGCDSGLCGTGIACSTCPVRTILTNSFKLKRDFESVTATMRLYDNNHKVHEVDVKVDGHLVYLGYQPHFLVKVK